MVDGYTFHHLLVALFFWLVTFVLACRIMPLHYAFFISLIKIAIPYAYFSFYFDGQWTFLDDWSYFRHGKAMLDAGFTPISALTSDGRLELLRLTGSYRTLYYYWNVLSLYLFGEHYFVPIYMNVMLTFVSAIFFYKIVSVSGFLQKYALYASIFFLLHWDVLAWFSVLNMKGSLVICLSLLGLFSILNLFKTKKAVYALLFLIICYLLYWLRFYIPLLLTASIVLWVILGLPENRFRYLLVFFPVLGFLYKLIDWNSIISHLNFSGIPYGLIRIILTPQPWSVESKYSFLFFPSVFQWLFVVPSVLGVFWLWRSSREARLLILFSCCILLLYAMFLAEQGPRHRLQVVYMFSWGLFHFAWVISEKLFYRSHGSVSGTPDEVGENVASQ